MIIYKLFWTNLIVTFLLLAIGYMSWSIDENSKVTNFFAILLSLSLALLVGTGFSSAIIAVWT